MFLSNDRMKKKKNTTTTRIAAAASMMMKDFGDNDVDDNYKRQHNDKF